MTILFISQSGDSLGLAMRCQSEGYSTFFFTENPTLSGDGIIPRPSFNRHVINRAGDCIASNTNQLLSETSPDLVIIDSYGLGKVADYIREQNLPVFGSSHWTDTLSTDPFYVKDILRRVSLDQWKGEEGVKVEVGVWWNGLSSLFPFIVWNEDRFLTGSLGCRVDSASNIITSLPSSHRLIVEGVGKMERLLKKSKYRGLISLECVVTKSKVYGVSFTTSTLYLSSLLELYKGSVTDLLLSTATGRRPVGEFTTDYALSLLLSIPPFPSPQIEYKKTAIKGISPSNLRHLYLLDVEKEGEGYEGAGRGGALMRVSARGRDVGECKKRVMKTVSNLSIEDVQYRTDSTKRFSEQEGKLQEWGYLN
jgi:phosphoribosylamine-glycine ligase